MYVSGSLKNKTINFYKEEIECFDDESFSTSDVTINYNGEITFSPWEDDKMRRLKKKQELYISELTHDILSIDPFKNRGGIFYHDYIIMAKRILEKVLYTPRNITYKLLECFYFIVTNPQNYAIFSKLESYEKLIDDLINYGSLNQWYIDIIISLFIKNKNYTWNDVKREELRYFNIDENDFDLDIHNIILLGKFIAQNRLRKISVDIKSDREFTKDIAPLYFAFKSDSDAERFLATCRKPDLDTEEIYKNAESIRSLKLKN